MAFDADAHLTAATEADKSFGRAQHFYRAIGITDEHEKLLEGVRIDMLNEAEAQAAYRLEMGRRLSEAKDILGHGQFGDWIEACFASKWRKANRWMEAYREWKAEAAKLDTVSNLVLPSPSVADLRMRPGNARNRKTHADICAGMIAHHMPVKEDRDRFWRSLGQTSIAALRESRPASEARLARDGDWHEEGAQAAEEGPA